MDFFPYPQNFMAGIYDFTVVFRKNSEFESYPGPFFRSVFGKVMREKFCTEGDTKCMLCSKNKICAYSILHEAPFDKKIELEFGISQTNLPKPFFMTPITEYPCKYKAGESMNVEVVFIGNSIKYLKEAVSCFVQAGNCGIDKNRYKFDLLSISDSISKKNIYEKGKYSSEKMVMYSAQTEKDEMELTSVGIHFLTPLRLQS
ncbi:MAG TPA: hypothetical protein PLT70_10235, partial [bacterium]|nr:hypothetical protein [bacterium]